MELFKIVNKWDNILFSLYNVLIRGKYLFNYMTIHSIVHDNKRFRNIHKGKRCFIVLNGPSLKGNDISTISDEIVFCVNYMYKSDIVDTIRPNYYCWMDSLIFTNPSEGRQTIKDLQKRCPNAELFLNYKAYDVIERNERTHFTYNKHMPSTKGGKYDIDGLSSGYTNVLGYVIGIAIYMGFEEINILGLDFNPAGFRHVEDAVDGPGRTEARNSETITSYGSILKAHCEFIGLAKYAKSRGINIHNLNLESYVRAFDFSTLQEVIKH